MLDGCISILHPLGYGQNILLDHVVVRLWIVSKVKDNMHVLTHNGHIVPQVVGDNDITNVERRIQML